MKININKVIILYIKNICITLYKKYSQFTIYNLQYILVILKYKRK